MNQRFSGVITGNDYSIRGADENSSAAFGAEKKKTQWMDLISMARMMKRQYRQVLTDDDMRIRVQFFVIYFVMSAVAVFMTILNAYTSWRTLGYVTGGFALLSVFNLLLCLFSEKAERLSRVLFSLEIIVMFGYFAISGNPEGFSVLWTLMLPACGMLLYRNTWGSVIALLEWLILIFLFWTPYGRSLLRYEYTVTFCQRFPILYLAVYFVGWFFEFIRSTVYKELISTRHRFEFLYMHDALTALYNRYGFNAAIDESLQKTGIDGHAFAIADIDDFKGVNDTYGHLNGDAILIVAANIIRGVVGNDGIVCRWGGEEFAMVFYDENKAPLLCRKIIREFGEHEFEADGKKFHVTLSIGLVVSEGGNLPATSEVITAADNNLYKAKASGKNMLVASTFEKAINEYKGVTNNDH